MQSLVGGRSAPGGGGTLPREGAQGVSRGGGHLALGGLGGHGVGRVARRRGRGSLPEALPVKGGGPGGGAEFDSCLCEI